MKSENPLSPAALAAGLIVTIVGGIIVAVIVGEGRFSPSIPTVSTTQRDVPASPTVLLPTRVPPTPVSPTSVPPTRVMPSPTLVLPSQTSLPPSPKLVPTWYRGDSRNSYEPLTSPNSFRVTAASRTDMNVGVNTAPLIIYSKSGDFEARVKVVVNPVEAYQFAGMGVRSANLLDTWLRIGRQSNSRTDQLVTTLDAQNQSQLGFNEKDIVRYSLTTVYLRIQRTGQSFTLSYSKDDSEWQIIANKYYLPMAERVDIFLVTISTADNASLTADFYDFALR